MSSGSAKGFPLGCWASELLRKAKTWSRLSVASMPLAARRISTKTCLRLLHSTSARRSGKLVVSGTSVTPQWAEVSVGTAPRCPHPPRDGVGDEVEHLGELCGQGSPHKASILVCLARYRDKGLF